MRPGRFPGASSLEARLSKSRLQYLGLNLVVIFAVSAAAAGCGGPPANGGTSTVETAGSVALTIQGTSITLNSVGYSIAGPNTYTGSIDVTNSTSLSATISPIVA